MRKRHFASFAFSDRECHRMTPGGHNERVSSGSGLPPRSPSELSEFVCKRSRPVTKTAVSPIVGNRTRVRFPPPPFFLQIALFSKGTKTRFDSARQARWISTLVDR